MTRKLLTLFVAVMCIALFADPLLGQGIIIPWAGPVNRSMGGAATAAPLDAISAVYWNPAAMADMPNSELSVGVELLFPIISTDSSIAGFASGSTEGEPGVIPLPQIGWVHKTANPNFVLGLGVLPAAGVRTNYPASTTNPLFTPQSNSPGVPGGLGQVFSEAQYLQILPSISYLVSDKLAIGIGPTVSIGQVVVDPNSFNAPDDADGSGVPRYPSGRGGKFQWGAGFQVSAYYKFRPDVNLGLLIKSPQWMEEVKSLGTDELGRPRNLSANFDLPMVISLGTSYTGIPGTTLAFDVRYIDHKNTDGFGPSGFNPDGSLAGLGFGNSYGAMAGIQQCINERLTVRGGYTYTSSPLSDSEAMIAMTAPLYYQHALGGGASINLTECTTFNLAYNYGFENELNGPILTPAGPIPGSNVATRLSFHFASLGIAVKY